MSTSVVNKLRESYKTIIIIKEGKTLYFVFVSVRIFYDYIFSVFILMKYSVCVKEIF